MRTPRSLAVAIALTLVSQTSAQASAQVPIGDSQVVASVPSPGYPEGIATRGNRFYVSGPATFGSPTGLAYVNAYDIKSGAAVTTYPITIANSDAGMSAASCAAFGPDGKLYVIEPFVGVIRMNLDPRNTQSVYSAFTPSGPSLLNDLAFGEDGSLYVIDSFAATIYRIPPGGGSPVAWFTDSRLAGDPALPFGVNGIRIDKKNKQLYVSVTVQSDSNLEGVIYRLPLVNNPSPSDLEEFHRYDSTFGPQAPDGIAFGKSGKLYVALVGTSQISVLGPDGVEEARYTGPAANPNNLLDPLPWANPANIAFDNHNGALLVTNHASLVPYDSSLFTVFDVSWTIRGSHYLKHNSPLGGE
jgi:sugar lactone lactonase YvrE